MSLQDWVDAALRVLDIIVSWPMFFLALVLLFRNPIATGWETLLQEIRRRRTFTMAIGAFNVSVGDYEPPEPLVLNQLPEGTRKDLEQVQETLRILAEQNESLDATLTRVSPEARAYYMAQAVKRRAAAEPLRGLSITGVAVVMPDGAKAEIPTETNADFLVARGIVEMGAQFNASHNDWTRAVDFLRADGFDVRRAPFEIDAFVKLVVGKTLMWVES